MVRTSVVNSIHIELILFNSVILIGDTQVLKPRSRVFAIHKGWEYLYFDDKEGEFTKSSLFSRPLPQPIIWENVNINIENKNPLIKVNHVKINGLSTAAVFQVGSNMIIDNESRTKHFRQLLARP
ncbi:spore germination protein GerPE [Tepidibacillus sp. LV47]|uniref:spore germination protein GerPE n=1 Tax=Tepidibacillus sp. LV47 TaxID=3398228 RepID=UPI003AAC9AD2